MRTRSVLVYLVFVAVSWSLPGTVVAGDWWQWLGPTRDGSSLETVAPWAEAPTFVWRQPVGEGHSSPVVADGVVYLHAKVKDKDEEEVVARDAKTGVERWRTAYPRAPFSSVFNNGPRGTPTVTGGKVYTLGVTGVLSCFEAANGAIVWQVDLLKQFKTTNLFFGVSGSPLMEDGKVFINVGGKGAGVVAFDAATGKIVWQALDDRASYSSPIVFGTGPQRQVVFLTGSGLIGLSPRDGNLFWRIPFVDLLSESSTTPVRLGNDLLLASSVTVGSVGVKLGTKEGKPDAATLWKNDRLTCYFSTPVPVDAKHVYMVTGTAIPPASATLRCIVAATGKQLWEQPKVGKYHATLLQTGNNQLLILGDNGRLALLEPNPEGYKEIAAAKISGETWAHPALANGLLYVRDKTELLCLRMPAVAK